MFARPLLNDGLDLDLASVAVLYNDEALLGPRALPPSVAVALRHVWGNHVEPFSNLLFGRGKRFAVGSIHGGHAHYGWWLSQRLHFCCAASKM